MASRSRHIVRVFAVAAATSSLLSGLALSGPAASARSIKDQNASAHQQLRDLNNQAETATEQYNAARIKLSEAQQAATRADAAVTTARGKLDDYQSTVAECAGAADEGGGEHSIVGLISDGDAGTYISQISSMQAVSASEARALAQVDAAQRIEAAAQATANAALAKQKAATTDMAAARDRILAAAAKQKKILGNLIARQAEIIKAAKAR